MSSSRTMKALGLALGLAVLIGACGRVPSTAVSTPPTGSPSASPSASPTGHPSGSPTPDYLQLATATAVVYPTGGVACPNRNTTGCGLTPALMDRVLHAFPFGDPICRCQNGYTRVDIAGVPGQPIVHVALYFGSTTALRHFDVHFENAEPTWDVSDITCEGKGPETGLFVEQLADCP